MMEKSRKWTMRSVTAVIEEMADWLAEVTIPKDVWHKNSEALLDAIGWLAAMAEAKERSAGGPCLGVDQTDGEDGA